MRKFDKTQIGSLQNSILEEEAKLVKKIQRELPSEFYAALYSIGDEEKLSTEQIVIRLQSVLIQIKSISQLNHIHIATPVELDSLIATVVGYMQGVLTDVISLGKKIELLEDKLQERDIEFKSVFSKDFDDEFNKRRDPWEARKANLIIQWNEISLSLPSEANEEWATAIAVFFKDKPTEDNSALDAAEVVLNRWKTLEQRREAWKARKDELVAEWSEIQSSVPNDVSFRLSEQTFQNKDKEDQNVLAEAAATLGYWQERLELENRWGQARKDGYFSNKDEERFKEALKKGESTKDNRDAEKIVSSKEAWNRNDRRKELIASWKELVAEAKDAEVNYPLRKHEFETIIRLDSLSDQYAYIQVGNTKLYTQKKDEFGIDAKASLSDRENHQVCSAVVLDLAEDVIGSMKIHIEKSKKEAIEREVAERAKAEAERQQAEKERVEREQAKIEQERQRKLSQQNNELNDQLDKIHSKVQNCYSNLQVRLSTLKSKIQEDKTFSDALKEIQNSAKELSAQAKKFKETEKLSGKTDEEIAKKQTVIAAFNAPQFEKIETEINQEISKIESEYQKKLEEDLNVSREGTEEILKQCLTIIDGEKAKVHAIEKQVTQIQLRIQNEDKLQHLAPTEQEKRLTVSTWQGLRDEVNELQRELKDATKIKEVECLKIKLTGKLEAIVEKRKQIEAVFQPVREKYQAVLAEKEKLLKAAKKQVTERRAGSIISAKTAVKTLETEGTKRLGKYHWWSLFSYTQQKRTKMSELQALIGQLKTAVDNLSNSSDNKKVEELLKTINKKLAAFKEFTKDQRTDNEKTYFATVEAAVEALTGKGSTVGAINRIAHDSEALQRTKQALDEVTIQQSSFGI